MLTLTADVNGHVIGKVFMHNTGKVAGDICTYDAAYVNLNSFGRVAPFPDMVIGIEVRHSRGHGWGVLSALVLDEVDLAVNAPEPTKRGVCPQCGEDTIDGECLMNMPHYGCGWRE